MEPCAACIRTPRSICPIVLTYPVVGAGSQQLGCNEFIVSPTLTSLLVDSWHKASDGDRLIVGASERDLFPDLRKKIKN